MADTKITKVKAYSRRVKSGKVVAVRSHDRTIKESISDGELNYLMTKSGIRRFFREPFESKDMAQRIMRENKEFIEANNITENESVLIYNYTSASYRVANDRNDLSKNDRRIALFPKDVELYRSSLEKSLDKLPNFEGTTYRYDRDTSGAKRLYLKAVIGKEITLKNFTSTGKDESILKPLFGESDEFPVINYKIKSKKGKDISRFSNSPEEREILFNRGSKFRLINFDDSQNMALLEEL